MSIAGQVWTFNSSLSNNNYYVVEDRGRVLSKYSERYEYSYLLYCLNDGKKIDYLIVEPIHEHGQWRKIA